MSKNVLYIVNFGSRKGGLSTIGYTIYNTDGTEYKARSTTGVVEIGTSTGIYCAPIEINENKDFVVLWDTGDIGVRYSVEEFKTQLNSIQEETDHIRLIWNSLRNQGEFQTMLADSINENKKAVASLEKHINSIKTLKLDDVNSVVSKQVKGIVFPKIDIPNYEKKLDNIESAIYKKIGEVFKAMVDNKTAFGIPDYTNSLKEYIDQFKKLTISLAEANNNLSKTFDEKSLNVMNIEIKRLSDIIDVEKQNKKKEKDEIIMSFGNRK
jgi:hypothetical protein